MFVDQFMFHVKPFKNLKSTLDDYVETQMVLTVEDWRADENGRITITPLHWDMVTTQDKIEFMDDFKDLIDQN